MLSMHLIPPGLRPVYHAVVMQFRCITSAVRSWGYACAMQLQRRRGASRLMRPAQLGAFLPLVGAEVLENGLGVLRLAAFCNVKAGLAPTVGLK